MLFFQSQGCNSTFKYQNNLTTHKKVHSPPREACAAIKSENEPVKKRRPARKHIYQEFKPIIQISDEENECPMYKCESCPFTFDLKEDLNVHLKSHFDGIYLQTSFLKIVTIV